VPGIQVIPPPCRIEYSFGHDSAPASPFFSGSLHNFPLHRAGFRIASFQKSGNIERVPSRAEDHVIANHTGADVEKYSCFTSAISLCQRSLPVFASSETR
jgi:hypothetical protein